MTDKNHIKIRYNKNAFNIFFMAIGYILGMISAWTVSPTISAGIAGGIAGFIVTAFIIFYIHQE